MSDIHRHSPELFDFTPQREEPLESAGPDDDQVCADDYPEHDYVLFDEAGGIRTLVCRRCGAETEEEVDG